MDVNSIIYDASTEKLDFASFVENLFLEPDRNIINVTYRTKYKDTVYIYIRTKNGYSLLTCSIQGEKK